MCMVIWVSQLICNSVEEEVTPLSVEITNKILENIHHGRIRHIFALVSDALGTTTIRLLIAGTLNAVPFAASATSEAFPERSRECLRLIVQIEIELLPQDILSERVDNVRKDTRRLRYFWQEIHLKVRCERIG